MSGSDGKNGGKGPNKDGGQQWKPSHNPWLVAVVVTVAAFMEVLDTTIVNVSLPHIAGNLSTSYDDATWALTSYLAANGIVLTISGWLGRTLGRKRYFLICIGSFTLCSFLCGISGSLPQLILFRAAQGFFGGGLQPNQQSIILDTFPPEKRGGAFAITALATIVAPVLGPTLGGYLTDNFSWRWVFFINVPIGIAAVLAVSALVEDPPWAKKRSVPIDGIGLSLIAIGLGCLEVMMDRGEDDDWFGSPFIRLMGILALLGCVGAVCWLLTTKRPAVDLYVFKDRNFSIGFLLIGVVGIVLYASAVLIPQFAQQVIGYTATLAGLVLSPGGLVIICLIPMVNMVLKKVQARYVIAFGFLVMGSSLILSSSLTPDIDFRHLVYFRMAQTASLGFLFVPISTVAFMTVPREQNGDASALFNVARNVLGAIGISASTALITERSQAQQAHMVHWMTPFHQPYQDYLSRVQSTAEGAGYDPTTAQQFATSRLHTEFISQTSILSYNECFLIISIIAFAVIPFCFLLKPSVGKGGGGGGH